MRAVLRVPGKATRTKIRAIAKIAAKVLLTSYTPLIMFCVLPLAREPSPDREQAGKSQAAIAR